ncbi:hypothetical protein Tco_0926733 [Tanacetum coccineum]|uniref:Uncharacterized protein n=1 Tax=Tanacetum coccineum TaxID=301880 RepID=A0ABQ5DGX9_9ASTR
MAVKEYLGTNLGVALQKVIQRHTVELILEYFVPADVIEYTIKSSDKAALNEFDQKQALFETMTASKSFNDHPKNMALYHALMESILVGKDAMDQGYFTTRDSIRTNFYGYASNKEIEVRRAYQQLYNFMEGDFLRLHLNDIKDMLLLIVQNKLFNSKMTSLST